MYSRRSMTPSMIDLDRKIITIPIRSNISVSKSDTAIRWISFIVYIELRGWTILICFLLTSSKQLGNITIVSNLLTIYSIYFSYLIKIDILIVIPSRLHDKLLLLLIYPERISVNKKSANLRKYNHLPNTLNRNRIRQDFLWNVLQKQQIN